MVSRGTGSGITWRSPDTADTGAERGGTEAGRQRVGSCSLEDESAGGREGDAEEEREGGPGEDGGLTAKVDTWEGFFEPKGGARRYHSGY